MNLPNALTILRIFFVPLLVAALVQESAIFQVGGVTVTNDWFALAISVIAFVGMLRWKWEIIPVVLGSGLLGLIYTLAGFR